MARRASKTPWLKTPFSFTPFFQYASVPVKGASKPDKGKEKDPITTQAVGEETAQPPPSGPTTPAIGEEGTGNVPTTTIAKGEEGGR